MDRRTAVVVLISMALSCFCTDRAFSTIVIDEELLELPKEDIAAHISSLLKTTQSFLKEVNSTELPLQRPPKSWIMCGYDCASEIHVRENGKGVFTLDMT